MGITSNRICRTNEDKKKEEDVHKLNIQKIIETGISGICIDHPREDLESGKIKSMQ